MGPKSGWGGDRLCQTSPIPRSPDGDNKFLLIGLSCVNGVICCKETSGFNISTYFYMR